MNLCLGNECWNKALKSYLGCVTNQEATHFLCCATQSVYGSAQLIKGLRPQKKCLQPTVFKSSAFAGLFGYLCYAIVKKDLAVVRLFLR